jgi:MarR family 2-MHQ and catechol resistance regulon transcriptional repressor
MSVADRIPEADGDERDRAAALKLWVVLSRAHRALARRAQEDIERQGLSLTDFAVLELLYHRGPQSLGDIGARVLLQSGSVTYAVDRLEQRRWVRRRPCTEDHRVTFAELTATGRSLVDRVFPIHADAVRAAMSGLSRREQDDLTTQLKRLGRRAAGLD